MNKQQRIVNYKELAKIVFIGILSFVAIFGIYNTFGTSLISVLNHIQNTQEKIANYFIFALTMLTMIVLQGINFKRKHLTEKLYVIISLVAITGVVLGVIFVFTNSIIYPLLSILTVGLTTYLLELSFATLGVRGFFFLITVLSAIILWLSKSDYSSNVFLINMFESMIALIIFIGATYPRIKSGLFKIAVRDNIELSNTGTGDSSMHEQYHDHKDD